MITLLLFVVLAVVSVMLYREGLWRSLLMFFNVLAAASVATGWFAPLATLLEGQLADYAHLVDFLSIWLLFCVVAGSLRELTDRISPTAPTFPPLVERIGAGFAAFLTGWVMMAFTAATLHTAPVPRDLIQPTPEARMFLSPDRKWLGWVRGSSLYGPFSRPDHPFDRDADFILRYADRRLKIEVQEGVRQPAK